MPSRPDLARGRHVPQGVAEASASMHLEHAKRILALSPAHDRSLPDGSLRRERTFLHNGGSRPHILDTSDPHASLGKVSIGKPADLFHNAPYDIHSLPMQGRNITHYDVVAALAATGTNLDQIAAYSLTGFSLQHSGDQYLLTVITFKQ